MRELSPKAEFATARKYIAAAMRSGRTSYPAIVRWVKQRAELSDLEIYGAMLLMEKLGEVEMLKPARYVGTVELTAMYPYLSKYKKRA